MTDTIASYRLQLRDGVDFAEAERRLDHIAGLGANHLYLSPILTAAPGSTHGYDVTDPTTIDPELGGRDGFAALSRAATERGLSVIVDIVPNHMDFGLDTPWLRDVLRRGPQSDHAPVFDIDWTAGRLALPWLQRPLPELAAAGDVSVSEGVLVTGELRVPLAEGSAAGVEGSLTAEAAERLHDAQHWQLLPWQLERDSITHRRFFSVTSLIGVRVEDPAVFHRTHALLFELIDEGLIHGLRVDHVDGLVDPGGYLRRLSAAAAVPIWAEKILVTGESLPDWPVAGTTGYEAAAAITRVLTAPEGLAQIDALWRSETGIEGDFHAEVAAAKREVLTDELAAELRQLRGLAQVAAEEAGNVVGPEMLREALTELLVAFPRYRSYILDGSSEASDLWRGAAERAATEVRSADVIDWIVETILAAETDSARRLAVRMEQVTGALIAKAHEDTAGFRFNRYLPANEVGGDPDRPVAGADEMATFLARRRSEWPRAITLGSSHDTKRSEDARARLIALSHAPQDLAALWEASKALPYSGVLDANRRFYALQTALCLWGEPDAADRVGEHMVKALREGKEVSYWTAPDEEQEGRFRDWTAALLESWAEPPDALQRIVAIGFGLSLREVALRASIPGMPDIYQGSEGALFQLTDPDNRRRPDWDHLARLPNGDGFAATKNALWRTLLDLRHEHPALFAEGDVRWEARPGGWCLMRSAGGRTLAVETGPNAQEGSALWRDDGVDTGMHLAIRLFPDTGGNQPSG